MVKIGVLALVVSMANSIVNIPNSPQMTVVTRLKLAIRNLKSLVRHTHDLVSKHCKQEDTTMGMLRVCVSLHRSVDVAIP